MTSSQTVFTGTLVACAAYLSKQIFDFYFFSRLNEYDNIRGQAISSAIFISHFLQRLPANAKEEIIRVWIDETQEVRRIAGRLLSFDGKRHRFLWGIPSSSEIRRATVELLGLSSCTREGDRGKALKHATELIKILNGSDYELKEP